MESLRDWRTSVDRLATIAPEWDHAAKTWKFLYTLLETTHAGRQIHTATDKKTKTKQVCLISVAGPSIIKTACLLSFEIRHCPVKDSGDC